MRQRVRYNFRGTALGNAADREYENSPFRRQASACLAKPAFLGGGEPRLCKFVSPRARERGTGATERERERERERQAGRREEERGRGGEKPDGAVKTAASEEDGRNL